MARHIHKWALAQYKEGRVIDLGGETKWLNPYSLWLCVCGQVKLLDHRPAAKSSNKPTKRGKVK